MATAIEGMSSQLHAPAILSPRKDPVPIVQEAGWAPGPVWTGAENLASTGIRSLDFKFCNIVLCTVDTYLFVCV